MRNVLLIVANILKVTFRKKGRIVIYIFLPILGVLLSLLLYSGSDSTIVNIGIVDHDTGFFSTGLKEALSSENFIVHDIVNEDINQKLLSDELDVAMIIDEGSTDSIYKGQPKPIEMITLKGKDITAWVEQTVNQYTNNLVRLSLASTDRSMLEKMVETYHQQRIPVNIMSVIDRQNGKQITYQTMGFLIMFVMLGTGFTSMFILREKRQRTYYRICSAPVNARQYILANSIASLLIIILQVVMILGLMKYAFHIDMGANAFLMFLILLIFGLVAIGIGLVVTAFSDSSYMAGNLTTLILTPSCMLGGCFWSVDMMPEFMQKISYFMPQRWVIDGIEKLQAGGNFQSIMLNQLVLAAFALALVLTAVYRFSRTEGTQRFI